MSVWWLYLTFCRVGLFTIGGGLAALPLLHDAMVGGGLLAEETFIDMIAVSQSTPGPIGINLATYVGFREAGVGGALAATAGMVTPSLVVIVLIAKFVRDYSHRAWVRGVMGALRPVAVGLIAAATWFVISASMWGTGGADMRVVALAGVLALIRWRWKRVHPVVLVAGAGLGGILIF